MSRSTRRGRSDSSHSRCRRRRSACACSARRREVNAKRLREGLGSDDDFRHLVLAQTRLGGARFFIDDTLRAFGPRDARDVPAIEAGPWPGSRRRRLPPAYGGARAARKPDTGSLADLARLEASRKGPPCSRHGAVPAFATIRAPAGDRKAATRRPARLRLDRAGCRRCHLSLSRRDVRPRYRTEEPCRRPHRETAQRPDR